MIVHIEIHHMAEVKRSLSSWVVEKPEVFRDGMGESWAVRQSKHGGGNVPSDLILFLGVISLLQFPTPILESEEECGNERKANLPVTDNTHLSNSGARTNLVLDS